MISKNIVEKLVHYKIDCYHGKLSGEEKRLAISNWKKEISKIMVATNAFGLGINTPDIRLVVHYDFPMGLREYIQESGQAARDGASAKSVILYSQSDFIQFNTFIIATNY